MSSAFLRGSSKAVIAATGFALVVSPLGLPAHAAPDGSNLVISEAYLNGGSTGAIYSHKFVEIYNPTANPIDLTGKSLQYRSPTGSTVASGVVALAGTVGPGDYFVVQGGSNAANGSAVPDVDQVSSISPGGNGGTLFLAEGTAAANPATTPTIDKLGWGTSNSPETTASAIASVTTSLQRQTVAGVVNKDTDDNSEDFDPLHPSPGAVYTAPPAAEEVTGPIAQIQGTDAAQSPHVGDIATTTGVVTAAYPTGGFNGFYIQTPGTGGATDATPGASDAIFVYGSAATGAVKTGDHVQVVGEVKEFAGTTEIVTDAASDVTVLEPAAAPTPLATELPPTEAAREAHEGELLAPSGPFTVTNTYAMNTYAEIGLAAGTTPLIQPTEVKDAQDAQGIAAVTADNAARAIALDDGSSTNYDRKDLTLPWLSKANPVRVGAAATFTGPVVLEFRNNIWKLQPTKPVTGEGRDVATFENTRTAAPEAVGGDVRLATFNVLNYFPTTGKEFVDTGLGTCTYYSDRAGNPITNRDCTPDGPRGAANEENFLRQQAKIVDAINKLDASIVSLEEIENSVKFGKDRDFAVAALVKALNAAAGEGTWAYAPSPAAADLPAPSEEDVIRTAFIYKPAAVELVGGSKVLRDEVNFDNAREPLAQAFKAKGAADSTAFAVIVNHFKSKGSGVDDGTGQGNANPDRIGQAEALAAFAKSFAAERGTDAVFLAGDFNAYTMEDPMQVLYGHGYTAVESDTHGEETYSFSGLSGSLDHVLANDAALATVTGADIWNISSGESLAFEYSRYNSTASDLYSVDPFRSSDHDPEIVGIDTSSLALKQVQILGTNDFHGRLANNSSGTEAGAAVLAGAVKQLRKANPNTVFAAAGDLIGASTFESFIANDKPTIDALNEAGLEVSAVGNHELDQGYDDLVNRVMAAYDAETNPQGGAKWQYIGANVKIKATGEPAVPASWIRDFGNVEVGFVGAVTEDLPSLVSPAGIAELEVTDVVEAANTTADDLRAEGADVVVLLVHEGAPTTAYSDAVNETSSFGQIVNGVDGDIDAIVSGHTHLAYNHAVPVPEWVAEGRDVTTRPVVSAGQYGSNLNQLLFTVDTTTGEVVEKSQSVLALKTGQAANYPVDAATKAIVDDAVARASVLGARPLGKIGGPFNRARIVDAKDTTKLAENRGGESTAGNLVAEVQRWATGSEAAGAAQIAFMNPGGLRTDMVGTGDAYPRELTYKQAAEVQPFANSLVNMRMTGAQIKTLLEQQWQRDGNGQVPTRPFLRLGVSEGFEYTYDPARKEGDRITAMWLNGEKIAPDTTYSVTANSFLASGGDNFHVFKQATGKRDTGKVDLQAMVDYMAAFAGGQPLPVDFAQRAVGVSFENGSAAANPGGTVSFRLSSLSYTHPTDTRDSHVKVSLGDRELGTFPVDSALATDPYDEYGKADVTVRIPAGTPAGKATLTVTGLTTGTSVPVPVDVRHRTKVTAEADFMQYGSNGSVDVNVASDGAGPVTGQVEVLDGNTVLGTASLVDGKAMVVLAPTALEPGKQVLTVRYLGDELNAPSQTQTGIQVGKANPVVRATLASDTVTFKRGTTTVDVTVDAGHYSAPGEVGVYVDGTLHRVAPVEAGKATVTVGPFDTVGERSVVVRYFGNDLALAASSEPQTLTVVRAAPRIRATHRPIDVVAGTRGTLTVRVSSVGEAASGAVVIRTAGTVVKRRLEDGTVSWRLPRYARAGLKSVRIAYAGSSTTLPGSVLHTVRVVRR